MALSINYHRDLKLVWLCTHIGNAMYAKVAPTLTKYTHELKYGDKLESKLRVTYLLNSAVGLVAVMNRVAGFYQLASGQPVAGAQTGGQLRIGGQVRIGGQLVTGGQLRIRC